MLNEVINKVEHIFQTFFISEYLEDVFLTKCSRVGKKKKNKVFFTFMKKIKTGIIAVSAVHITAKSKSFIYSSEILKEMAIMVSGVQGLLKLLRMSKIG